MVSPETIQPVTGPVTGQGGQLRNQYAPRIRWRLRPVAPALASAIIIAYLYIVTTHRISKTATCAYVEFCKYKVSQTRFS